MKRKIAIFFICGLLTSTATLQYVTPAYAFSNLPITVYDYVIEGLEKIEYKAINGDDIKVDFNMITTEMDGNFYNTYYLESPKQIAKLPSEDEMPSYLDSDTIISILSLREMMTLNYVRFDNQLISDINIEFMAKPLLADIKTFGSHVFMYRGTRTVTTNLTLGNQSRVGKIKVLKYDNLTHSAIPGTVFEVRDAEGKYVTSLTTDQDGQSLSSDLKVGEYYVKEIKANTGYILDETVYRLSILGNGSIVDVVSEGKPVTAIVNFIVKNSVTSAPVGGSIFDILDENDEVVTRIEIGNNGQCLNIKLAEGKYYLRETTTNLSYELLTELIPFETKDGEVVQIDIGKSSAFNYTQFLVLDDNNKVVPTVELNLYHNTGEFITTLKTDNKGTLTLSLPQADYYVSTVNGITENFSVTASEELHEVQLVFQSFTGRISGIVLDSNDEPVPTVSIIAVSDEGVDHTTAVTNFEGKFELQGIPSNSVIHLKVSNARYEKYIHF